MSLPALAVIIKKTNNMTTTNWTSIFGSFDLKTNELVFKGGLFEYEKSQQGAAIGNLLCDQYFGGGKIPIKGSSKLSSD